MAGPSPDAPVDLHTHTTASDGSDSPADLVSLAARRGLAAIAVTDHDTLAGVPEALEAGRRFGVELIAGVEISVQPPADVRDAGGAMHVLGYFVNIRHAQLVEALAWMRERRAARNPEIVRRLNGLGIDLTYEEVLRYAEGGQAGRPHVAQALVAKGVVASVREAFDRYLANGGPAAVEKEKLPVRRALDIIRSAGGVAVLAHPYQLGVGEGDRLEAHVRALAEQGLGGIECRYSSHSPDQTERCRELARTYGLAETGGSDYHGATKPGIPLGLLPGVPYRVVTELKLRRDRQAVV